MSKEKIKCAICGKEFNIGTGFSYHLSTKHKLTQKEYYDKYLKEKYDGSCIICHKPTKFLSIKYGYKETCSSKCTCMQRYGVEHNSQIPEVKAKVHTKEAHQKAASKHNYKEIVEKGKKTKLERYGDENYSNREKAKQTNLKNIGYESYLSLKSVYQKGVEASKTPEVKEKILKTKLKKKEEREKLRPPKKHLPLDLRTCEICNRKLNSLPSLMNHLRLTHHYTGKQYYDKFFKKSDDEGKCEICGKPTKFLNIDKGYKNMCSIECSKISTKQKNIEKREIKKVKSEKEKLKRKQERIEKRRKIFEEEQKNKKLHCAICEHGFNTYGNLVQHIQKKHSLKVQEYYDIYLKSSTEGTCKICGNPTKFISISKGYKECCCTKHTNLFKYGDANYNNSEKIKQTCLERYGVENVYQSEEVKEKIKQTFIEKYGVESPFQAEEIKEKSKATCLEKYGVEYSFQSDNNKEKSKQTMLKKYGVEHNSALRDKHVINFCKENDVIPVNKLNLYAPNKVLEHFNIKPLSYMNQYFIPSTTNIKKLQEYSKTLYETQGTIAEKELELFLKENSIVHIMRDFSIIYPQQLDCYIPDKKIAIEIDGIYWHSSLYKDKNYHLNKTNKCLEKGVRLIHFTDFEWANKPEICKSIIIAGLGLSNKIYARDCEVREVETKERRTFLENNHIDGNVNASYSLGLYYNNELVQIISIGKSRFKSDEYELLRMCSKLNTTIVGGFSKLLKHQPYKRLISYIDRAKFSGEGYLKNGFVLVGITKPSYKYYMNNYVLSLISAQKHKLPALLGDKFDETKTEQQNMIDAGYLCVYDCGTYKFEFIK